ncbi:MAG TPA: hypothetical protein VMA09_18950 [Candidatus Binataceae bacterium]|nr:hypothetical protein [Candidatus Binataceae bacterium]
MYRTFAIVIAIMVLMWWGCNPNPQPSGDWKTLRGATLIDGPLVVHGPLTIQGAALVAGFVRARKIKMSGPLVESHPDSEPGGSTVQEFKGATWVQGVLEVNGSLDVDGDLTVQGSLMCEGEEETPSAEH